MILNLTDLSEETLQSQISRQIRARILAGELASGDTLPSIRALARDHHVSVITVQRAYETLERQKLIHSRRGKGFFVSRLSENTKKEMSKTRLRQHLQAPLIAAFEEGLTEEDIREIVGTVIKQNGASG